MMHQDMTHYQAQPLSPNTLFSLSNAGLYRGKRWLVRNIDLKIDAREIITLIGPNGAGKSTIAKMALGLIKPDEGHSHRRKNLQIGYVPQKLSINWTMPLTVERFLCLTTKLSNDEIIACLDRTMSLNLRKKEMFYLSGGEFQRVMLSRAIAKKPDLLVLDEPVQGVDHAGSIALYELIKSLNEELNCGILMISHDLNIVMAGTDKVVCVNGHICCQGSPFKVVKDRQYQQLFGHHHNPALAVYAHHHDHHHLDNGDICDASTQHDCAHYHDTDCPDVTQDKKDQPSDVR
jgi:zinc transport system ATP-binding protein